MRIEGKAAMTMTPESLKEARHMLGLSLHEFAIEVLSLNDHRRRLRSLVARLESGDLPIQQWHEEKVRNALQRRYPRTSRN